MRPTLLINTHAAWEGLKTVSPATCILSQLGDIQPYKNGPVIKAPTVVFDNCDKNFVNYWLNGRTFPFMNTLVMHSHPCDPGVVRWMAKRPHIQISVHQNWYRYINRWCHDVNKEAPHIIPISDVEYRKLLNKLLAQQHTITTKD